MTPCPIGRPTREQVEEVVETAQYCGRAFELARAVEARDMSALQSDEVQQSAERVRTYTEDTCDPTS